MDFFLIEGKRERILIYLVIGLQHCLEYGLDLPAGIPNKEARAGH